MPFGERDRTIRMDEYPQMHDAYQSILENIGDSHTMETLIKFFRLIPSLSPEELVAVASFAEKLSMTRHEKMHPVTLQAEMNALIKFALNDKKYIQPEKKDRR
ncbi:hypothetical protein GF340_04965 [Candidatus Peregrinibacteria bacterium]|nr:hypothetical protein [Candidatus Peregrinibacteria bacterium]